MLKGLAITPPVLGRISIGKVIEKNGKRLPEKDDQFTITSQVQGKDGWLLHPLNDELRQGKDDKLRSIPVRLLFNEPELNFRADYTLFDRQSGRPLCVGNGETCKRVTQDGMQSLPCPSPDACPLAKGGACKPYGRLNVVIGDEDPLGSFVFRTTGFNSIRTLAARLGYTLAPGHELGLNLIRIDSRNWYDGGGYNARGGADVGNDAATEVIALESRNRLADNWQSTLRLAQSKDESTGFRVTSRYNSKQEQLLWQNDIKLAVGSLMLAYEHVEQNADSSTTYTVKSRDISSFMAGWNGALGNHLLQANLRHDSNSQFGDKLTHVLGYGYRITPQLRTNASLGTSFKAPTLNDLYYVDSGGNHGDPNLKPEEGRNRELALRYDAAGTRASVVYFDNKIDNLIQWGASAPTWAYVPTQTSEARIKGWEFAYGALLGAWEVSASLDLLDPRNEATDKLLARRARETARLGVTRSFGALTVGSEVFGSGKRFDDGDTDGQ